MNLNKVFVLGNVTKDPEVRALPSGQQVVSFGIATNRVWKDAQGQKKEEAEFHNIVAFGKMADTISRYVLKGSLLLIEGRLKTSTWDDKTTGAKRYKTEIIAEGMQLGPKGSGASGNSETSGYSRPSSSSKRAVSSETEEIPVIEENYPAPSEISFDNNDSGSVDVKDIPF